MDAIPVIDLRLLTQAELNALATSSASSALDPRRADDIIVPKIDRSVFNESAGSRKQTYSRLRLAPPKAASSGPTPARRRGRPRSTARALPGNAVPSVASSATPDASAALDEHEKKEKEEIIQFLRQLFANNGRTENLTPPKLTLNPKPVPVTETNISTGSTRNANGEANPLPENAVLAVNDVSPASGPKKRGRKKKLDKEVFGLSFNETEGNDFELRNVNDVPIDLTRLGEKENLFREELIKRTEGLVTEEEFLDYLTVLEGRWGSRRKRRKIVDAGGFGDWLPKGWKLLLGLKRQGKSVWLHCRRFVSPSGKQFKSCKEISSYLLSLVGTEGIIKIDNVKVDGISPSSDKSLNGCAAGAIVQGSTAIETPSCSLSSSSKVENHLEVQLNSILECQKFDIAVPDEESRAQNLRSVDRKNAKRCKYAKSITDGVIVKDGTYECQFCHKVFTERHRYNGHVGVHVKSYCQSSQVLSNDITIDHVPEPSILVGLLIVSEINPIVENERSNSANKMISVIPIRESATSTTEISEYEKAESSLSPISCYTPDPSFELSHNSTSVNVDNCNGMKEMKVNDRTCKQLHTWSSRQFDNTSIIQTATNAVCKVANTTVPDCISNFSTIGCNSIIEKKCIVDQQVVESEVDDRLNEYIDSNSHTKLNLPPVTQGSPVGIPDDKVDSGKASECFAPCTDNVVDMAPAFNTTAELSETALDAQSSILADSKVINIHTEKETDCIYRDIEPSEPAFDVSSSILADKVILLIDAEKGNGMNTMKAGSSERIIELSANASVERDKGTDLTDSKKSKSFESEMEDSCLAENGGEVECSEMPLCESANDSDCSYDSASQKLGDALDISNALSDARIGAHSDPEGQSVQAASLDETSCLASLDANPLGIMNNSKNSVHSNIYSGKLVSRSFPESTMPQTCDVAETDSTCNHASPLILANDSSGDAGNSTPVVNISSHPSLDLRALELNSSGSPVCETSIGNLVFNCSSVDKIAETAAVAETELGSDFVNHQDPANKPSSNILKFSNDTDVCFDKVADARGVMLTDSKSSLYETSTGEAVSHTILQDLTNNTYDTDISLNQSPNDGVLGPSSVVESSLCETSFYKEISSNPTIYPCKSSQHGDKLNSDSNLSRLSITWQSSYENNLFGNTCLEETDNSLREHQFFLEHNLSSPSVDGTSYQIQTGDDDMILDSAAAARHESLNFDSLNKQAFLAKNGTVDSTENVEHAPSERLTHESSGPNCLGGLLNTNQNHSTKNQMLATFPGDVQKSDMIEGSGNRLGGEFRYNPDGCKDDYERNALENVSANTYQLMRPSNFLSTSMMSNQYAENFYANQRHNYTEFEGVQLENFSSSNSAVMPNQAPQIMPEVQINLTCNKELGNVFESSIQSEWDLTSGSLGERHHHLPAVCNWCGSEFNPQGVNHQMQESIGFICPSCKSKFSVQLKF